MSRQHLQREGERESESDSESERERERERGLSRDRERDSYRKMDGMRERSNIKNIPAGT